MNTDVNATFSYPPAGLDGELEVTRLGREVLFAVLDWIDPRQDNASVVNLRRTLETYAAVVPQSASLKVTHGSADFRVDVQRASGVKQAFLYAFYMVVVGQTTFPIPDIPMGAMLERIAKR